MEGAVQQLRVALRLSPIALLAACSGSVFVNDSRVVATDITASNGVIHVVDTVILPQS
jgi:uncharacterized surface protein with fasciclin (FAS1) repeats